MRSFIVSVVAVVALGCGSNSDGTSNLTAPSLAPLSTIVDVPVTLNEDAGLTGTWNFVGQSLTTPSDVRLGSLHFNWYLYGSQAGMPTAFGTLYVLTTEFTGVPGDLSASTPGFVAKSAPAPVTIHPGTGDGTGTEYVFADDVTLDPGRRYYFYCDTQGAFATTFDQDLYSNGQVFLTGLPMTPFHPGLASGHTDASGAFHPAPPGATIDANFRLKASSR